MCMREFFKPLDDVGPCAAVSVIEFNTSNGERAVLIQVVANHEFVNVGFNEQSVEAGPAFDAMRVGVLFYDAD